MPYANFQSDRARLVRRRNVTKYHERLRVKTLMLHGGQCERCGINDVRVLQLDHINGGGHRERVRNGNNSHTALYAGLRRPHEFQILCANCNWIKRYENDEVARRYPKAAVAVGGM